LFPVQVADEILGFRALFLHYLGTDRRLKDGFKTQRTKAPV
jgi:hypothetical protein